MTSYVSHLEGAIDGTRLEPGRLWNLHKDRPIVVRYDLPAIARAVKPSAFRDRAPSLWRYRELLPLPLDVEPVTLGEGMTPLLPLPPARRVNSASPICGSRTNRNCRPAASRAAA